MDRFIENVLLCGNMERTMLEKLPVMEEPKNSKGNPRYKVTTVVLEVKNLGKPRVGSDD